MDFMNAIKDELDNKLTYTENGALAYETSGKALMDFVFSTAALRREDEEEIMRTLTKVYFECPLLATKALFWTRDCREGNGERRIFREFLKWLAWNEPEVGKAVLDLVPYYGRWDDLWVLLDTDLKDDVIELVRDTIKADLNAAENGGNNCSLLGKWLKSENTSSRESRRIARIIRNGLGLSPRGYRKTLTKLRKHIDIIESKISANEWGAVDYSKVPSQANIKYTNAFLRHDEERRRKYLEDLKNGKTKINASVLQPHEIVAKYITGMGWNMSVGKYDEALEQMWKALPVKSLSNTLVCRDGSGSMAGGYGTTVRPLDVATALAVYMADHNHGIWKDKFITFSANPKFVDLSYCTTLHDKLVKTYHEDDCSNTDIEKTMMLILKTAIKNNCSQEDMPTSILIVSDMGFDSAVYDYDGGRTRKALFDNIAKAYEKAGYKLPRMVFWNVAGKTGNGIPMKQNDLGVILLGGFSIQLLDMVMSGELDPFKAILSTINASRYDLVENAIKDII